MSETKLHISANVLTQKVADESVLLDLESQSYFGLDGVATVIWEAISGRLTEDDIVERITDAFEVDAEVARKDLRAFLDQLEQEKLLTTP